VKQTSQGGNHNPHGRKGSPERAKRIQRELEGRAAVSRKR